MSKRRLKTIVEKKIIEAKMFYCKTKIIENNEKKGKFLMTTKLDF